MSGTKRLIESEEQKRQTAIEIAIETGALKQCEAHEYVLEGSGDSADAYKLGNSLVTREDARVADFGGDRRELSDLIKMVIDEHGPDCPGCEAAQRG